MIKYLGGGFLVVLLLAIVWGLKGFDDRDKAMSPATAGPEEARQDAALEHRSSPQAESVGDRDTREPADALSNEAIDNHLQRHVERGCIPTGELALQNLAPVEQRELKDWLESEGHYGDQILDNPSAVPNPFPDYQTYDDASLNSLAEGGDGAAHMVLGQRLLAEVFHADLRLLFRAHKKGLRPCD